MNNKRGNLVSIIITTKNEESTLERLLKSVNKQTYSNIELIIVDNKSTDHTLAIAKKYSNKTFSFGPERSAQRNFGAKKAKGDYILVLDADMKLSPKVVQECVNLVGKNSLAVGVVIPEQSVAESFWGRVKEFERSFYNAHGDPITDAARFFSKKIFFKVGGYDETITGPEDWDLPDTIRERGYKLGRISSKIYHFEEDISLVDLFRKKFYYGLHAHKYLNKHNIPVVSPRTVYFLRPLFYKNWKKLISRPDLTIALIVMLTVETLGGGLGYLIGRIKNK